MSIAAILRDTATAETVLEQLRDAGVGGGHVWVAARSNEPLDACEARFGTTTVRSGVRNQGLVAGLARAAGFGSEDDSNLTADLIARGLDDERATYFASGLDDTSILIGIGSQLENPDVANILLQAGGDLGLVNGAGTDRVIPLRRELLDVVKHVVIDAEVSVRTEVVSETKLIEVVLEREDFVIERRDLQAADNPVTITRIPLRHEEAVFEKRVVVTAEVSVTTTQHVDVTRVSETLRHEVLRVDDPAGVIQETTAPVDIS